MTQPPASGTADDTRVTRALQAAGLFLACCAIAIFAFRSLAGPLWLDELLTMTLVQADSLTRLWTGIVGGIDGNPPLYLTMAWLIVHAMPRAVSSVAVLELTSFALTMAATFALYRVGRRVASATACWIGLFLFAALNDNLIYVAVELRTYALYFFMAALAVLFQQRLIERQAARDTALLGLIYAGLTLAHTFGIVYVGCIALAGGLSQLRDGWPHWRRIAFAVAPAILVLAGWMPFFIQQSAVGRPYMWVYPATLPDLLESLFASKLAMWIAIVELACLASAVITSLRRGGLQFHTVFTGPEWQPQRYVALLVTGISGFTLAVWIISVSLYPLFVPRYFTPQLIVGFALHVAFCEWLMRQAQQRLGDRTASLAVYAAVVPPLLLGVVMLCRDPFRNDVPCANSAGTAFEAGFVNGDLPVIAESPHVFLPRATYANHREAYRFPLDWDVVMNYPERARGNAVDYNVMRSLQKWGPMPAVVTTEDIVKNFPQFLAIEQSGRAWFHNLRTTRDVVAEKLAATDDQACTLWKVTSVKPRP